MSGADEPVADFRVPAAPSCSMSAGRSIRKWCTSGLIDEHIREALAAEGIAVTDAAFTEAERRAVERLCSERLRRHHLRPLRR